MKEIKVNTMSNISGGTCINGLVDVLVGACIGGLVGGFWGSLGGSLGGYVFCDYIA